MGGKDFIVKRNRRRGMKAWDEGESRSPFSGDFVSSKCRGKGTTEYAHASVREVAEEEEHPKQRMSRRARVINEVRACPKFKQKKK